MKRIYMLCFVLLSVVESAFCQNGMEIKIDNFSITLPTGWMAQYTNSSTVFFMYSPIEENDTFQENGNLTTDKLPSTYTVKGYMKAAQDTIKIIYGNFNLIESGENYHIISGSLNDTMIMQIQFVAIRDNIAYILTYTSNPENFDRYLDTFISIQKTFKY